VELAIGTWRISVWRLPPSPSELRRLYDTTAWYWNSFLHRMPFGSAYVRLFKQLEKDGWLGGTGDTTRVLDCGVGTGVFSGALLQTVNRRFEICGIDLSPKMLAKARSRLIRRGLALRLECGDVCSLPCREGEMDVVISALMLEHAPNPLAALREMVRVARPGATLVVVVTRPHAPDVLFRLIYRYQPFRPLQVVEWMTQAGLRDTRPYRLVGIARLLSCAYVGRKPR
jgi:ubiquinone/menaquinone biosynthesis C-methylase UbiE